MRLVPAAAAALVVLTACTTRPRAASGPTFAWDTANSVVRATPRGRVPKPSGAPMAAGRWTGTYATKAGDRAAVLHLESNGRALLEFSPAVDGAPSELEGGWGREATWVRIEFFRADTTAMNVAVEYELTGDELFPVTRWDAALFGSEEPPRFARR